MMKWLSLLRKNCGYNRRFNLYFLNCSHRNLPFFNYKTYMRRFMKPLLTKETLFANSCPPACWSNWKKKIKAAPEKDHSYTASIRVGTMQSLISFLIMYTIPPIFTTSNDRQ